MIRLKNLLTEDSAKTYTTKKSWTLKTTKGTFKHVWDVVLNIPAGTVWKLLKSGGYEPGLDTTYRGSVIETTTPVAYKVILRDDPKVYKYTKAPVRAAHYHESMQAGHSMHILIGTRPEIFPDEYQEDLRSFGVLGASSVFETIDFDVNDNPHAEDLFYNLEQTFEG